MKPLTTVIIGALVVAVAVVGYLYYQRTRNDITIQMPKVQGRRDKEQSMRRRRLKKLIRRLRDPLRLDRSARTLVPARNRRSKVGRITG
jgi:hypothetical protein